MHEKINMTEQMICSFHGVSVRICDKGVEEMNNISSKVVMIDDMPLMDVTIASGRADVYNYIELYNMRPEVNAAGRETDYFGSKLEDMVLGFFSRPLGRADIIHVEYAKDSRTWSELQAGVPVVLSRLGCKLFSLSFTWFKDWYIAEGWREGPVKLTAEKPVDEEMVVRNLSSHKAEIDQYLKKSAHDAMGKRAADVIDSIEKLLNQPSLLLTP